MNNKKLYILLVVLTLSGIRLWGQKKGTRAVNFKIARLKYDGGGDWYCDPSSLPNLLSFANKNAPLNPYLKEKQVAITDENFFSYPYLYMSGHGNIKFSQREILRLRQHLKNGGFLHADDNYGMDESFRREIKKVFPNKALVELPASHDIYHILYDFPNGLPKIHKHDSKPAQGFGIFHQGRLVVFYSYESDLGDGWESPRVHNDPPQKRKNALRMGTNIILYSLTQ